MIKASVLLDELSTRWPVLSLDTGQHYDFEMNGLLYRQLNIPSPDEFLEVGSGEPADQTAAVLSRTAAAFRRHRPSLALVIGDTNSTLGCALAASKEGIPLVHIEAGLRASEHNLPEESNRRVVDALAHLLCAPSESAAARLRAEQVRGRVRNTGDVARDVLLRHLEFAPPPSADGRFALTTLHRASLTSDREALRSALAGLSQLGMPVVFPAHPRTRQALERFELLSRLPAGISLTPPLGYLESLAAVRDAHVVITDSGGVQREAYWLGTPCVTLRSETEWQETLDCGANALVDPHHAEQDLARVAAAQRERRDDGVWRPEAYGDGHAAERIAAAVAALVEEQPDRW